LTWFLIFLAILAVVIWKMMGKSSSQQAAQLPDYERGKPRDLGGMSRKDQNHVYTFERQPQSDRSAAKFKRPQSDPSRSRTNPATPPAASLPRQAPQMGRAVPAPSRGRWIAPGETVEVAGFRYGGGMVYFGKGLEAPRGGGVDNCLIDPSLKVSPYSPDRRGHTMHYWPSYSSIQPEARRAYLEWLAGGRKDPEVGIGYVFLFFYGLERRLFVERVCEDFPAIAEEVRRLVSIYGGNGSFHGYANRLLDTLEVMSTQHDVRPALSPDMRVGYEMPMAARIYLGRLLDSGAAFEADDALVWLLGSPETGLRTPATRCFDELVPLWRLRFAERYPSGLKVRAPKSRLKMQYRPASGNFEIDVDVRLGGRELPDVAALSAPLSNLHQILDGCTDELGVYSRFLGKNPEGRGTVEAAHLLPKELFALAGGRVEEASKTIEGLFEGRTLVAVRTELLLETLGIELPAGAKVNTAMATQVGAFLDRIDVGHEPDRRYGPGGPAAGGRVLLFKAAGGAPVDAEAGAYKAARTMIEISAMAAHADGAVAEAEFTTIRNELRNTTGLSEVERARLLAHASILLKDGPRQQSALGRLAKLPVAEKRQAAKSAVSAVLADGHASGAEVKFLEKLYKTLGFPTDEVYAALHRGGVEVDEPVAVAKAEPSRGVPIPKRPEPASPTSNVVEIDAARLERIKAETSAVSSLLADIFVEDTPPPPAPFAAPSSGPVAFKGLDAAHGELLAAILSAGSLVRGHFDERARALRLLPDGAIETINEWGFETFEEPVIEDDDDVAVAGHLRSRLEQLEKAA
jgi:tellurite resistance protein